MRISILSSFSMVPSMAFPLQSACGVGLAATFSRECLAYFWQVQDFVQDRLQAGEQQGKVLLGVAQGRGEAEDVVVKGAEHGAVAGRRCSDLFVQFQGWVELALGVFV